MMHGWLLRDLPLISEDAPKVFSCFHCGGGSTMGYKLAGANVLGGVEIDPKMMAVYRANHHPRLSYLMSVRDFARIPLAELPQELLNLDILDGSPPCSSFSISGARDKKWGEAHKFREGQAEQVLDDLFFDFIDIAKKLQPKVVIAENVKGLIIGKAKGYVKQIIKKFDDAGFHVQLFLLNAQYMNVPQARERTFFIARRKDLSWPSISLKFNNPLISASSAMHGVCGNGRPLTEETRRLWSLIKPGENLGMVHKNGSRFNFYALNPNKPSFTVTATATLMHWSHPRFLSDAEIIRLQTFPDDFNFLNQQPTYMCGMSVPPRMMQCIAQAIIAQWFKRDEVPDAD
jgi:DNA (cytosine-5)-methyltransferase 1